MRPKGFSFTASGTGLAYEEHEGAVLLRSVFAGSGLVAIVFSYVFIDIVVRMGSLATPAKVGGAIASVLSVAAFWLFGGYCLRVALFFPVQVVVFDRDRRQLVYTTRSPVRRRRSQAFPFSAISRMAVVSDVPSEGEVTYSLVLDLAGAKPIGMGVFNDSEEAEAELRRIRQVVEAAA